ncbi:MAG: hypothetical protein SwBeaBPW_26300 [Shewanella algae]
MTWQVKLQGQCIAKQRLNQQRDKPWIAGAINDSARVKKLQKGVNLSRQPIVVRRSTMEPIMLAIGINQL